jgi:valyl-tRNA synthetase
MVLKMEDLVKPAIQSVLVDGDIKLHPKRFGEHLRSLLNNIRDWNISVNYGGNKFRLFLWRWKEDFV